jgi:hypothetical protein
MGFNSAFKGLIQFLHWEQEVKFSVTYFYVHVLVWHVKVVLEVGRNYKWKFQNLLSCEFSHEPPPTFVIVPKCL